MSLQSGKLHDGSSDNEMLLKVSDPALDSRLKSLRRAELELEEILDDPYLEQTRSEIASMFKSQDDFQTKKSGEAYDFIKNALAENPEKARITKEIKDFRIDISKSDINDISAEWVMEWHRKKQMQAVPSKAEIERKNFIETSLNPEQTPVNEASEVITITGKNSSRRLLRYSALAAAAVLGVLVTLKTILPTAGSEQIYNSFYNPYEAVSTVTRGIITSSINYRDALENYRNGNYSEAETGFKEILNTNPSQSSALLLLGLSQLETGSTDEAIRNLSSVINNSGSFVKEARWYLGLAYLRKDDRKKAAECFNVLSASEGYYRDASAKILRRLK